MPTPDTDPGLRFTSHWVRAQSTVGCYLFGVVRNWHDAEDLLQQVAETAYANFASYDSARPFGPWVLRMARNAAIDHFRKDANNLLVFDSQTLDAMARAHERIDNDTAGHREALELCLERLHDRARHIIRLRYVESRRVSAIAEDLRTTPNAVSQVLAKARAALAECIERRIRAGRAVIDREGEA